LSTASAFGDGSSVMLEAAQTHVVLLQRAEGYRVGPVRCEGVRGGELKTSGQTAAREKLDASEGHGGRYPTASWLWEWGHIGSAEDISRLEVAERVGFEPTKPLARFTGIPGFWAQVSVRDVRRLAGSPTY